MIDNKLGDEMGPPQNIPQFNNNYYPDHPSDFNDTFLYEVVFFREA